MHLQDSEKGKLQTNHKEWFNKRTKTAKKPILVLSKDSAHILGESNGVALYTVMF